MNRAFIVEKMRTMLVGAGVIITHTYMYQTQNTLRIVNVTITWHTKMNLLTMFTIPGLLLRLLLSRSTVVLLS